MASWPDGIRTRTQLERKGNPGKDLTAATVEVEVEADISRPDEAALFSYAMATAASLLGRYSLAGAQP